MFRRHHLPEILLSTILDPATVLHELRTPLTSIYGWTKLLQRDDVIGARVEKPLDVIERSVKAQAQLVEDLLNISKITTGKLRLEPVWIESASVINAAVDAVRPAAIAKGIDLVVKAGATDKVFADPNRLQQVIWNLLTNAIKFTGDGGRVEIESHCTVRLFQIVVRDTGEGIDPEAQQYIFERFRQADSSGTRKHGGLGLGLSIARDIVQLHGGTVRVSSKGKGRGTTFTVNLPVPS